MLGHYTTAPRHWWRIGVLDLDPSAFSAGSPTVIGFTTHSSTEWRLISLDLHPPFGYEKAVGIKMSLTEHGVDYITMVFGDARPQSSINQKFNSSVQQPAQPLHPSFVVQCPAATVIQPCRRVLNCPV